MACFAILSALSFPKVPSEEETRVMIIWICDGRATCSIFKEVVKALGGFSNRKVLSPQVFNCTPAVCVND